MINKRGQLTIFIIIAIIAAGVVVVFFAFREGMTLEKMSPEVENVYSFIEECIKDVGEKGVYRVGAGGGYYIASNFSTDNGIPYYFANKKNYMPSKEQMGKEIGSFVSEQLLLCTRNFTDFPNLDIRQEKINTFVEITDEKVILSVNYPIRIIHGERRSILSEFNGREIRVRFGTVYNAIDTLMQEQLKSEGICLSCMLDVSLKNDLYVDMIDYNDKTVIFIFSDENSKLNGKPFEFVFANEYR
jgi:hypothetical protein